MNMIRRGGNTSLGCFGASAAFFALSMYSYEEEKAFGLSSSIREVVPASFLALSFLFARAGWKIRQTAIQYERQGA